MSTSPRFTGSASTDNTDRRIKNGFQNPAYAASIAVTIAETDANTLVQVAQLTGALTITIGVGSADTPPYVGDKVRFMFQTDGTQRIVTFGTGFVSSGTLTIPASKYGSVEAVFNGAKWQVVSREITA